MQILCDMDVDEFGAHMLPIFVGSFRFFSVTVPENVKYYYQQSHNIHLTNERVATFCLSSQSSQLAQSSTAIMEQLSFYCGSVTV